jgi:tetratricopeptide (TPR) repeat protein
VQGSVIVMRPRTLIALALVGGSVALAFPIAAAGGKASANDAAQSKPQGEFDDAINQGCVKYVAKDIPGAIELFRKATQIQPRNPLGYYLLGEAQLGAGSLPDAEAAWLQADQVSDSGPTAVKAKILFVLADLRERQGRWDDAKVAWKRYADFAGTPDSGAFPESAATRIKDIETMQKQYKDYAIVRKRIRDEDGGALGKMPPPEKP